MALFELCCNIPVNLALTPPQPLLNFNVIHKPFPHNLPQLFRCSVPKTKNPLVRTNTKSTSPNHEFKARVGPRTPASCPQVLT